MQLVHTHGHPHQMGALPHRAATFPAWARDPVHASVFQPGVQLHDGGRGLLGWQRVGRDAVVLGPPLAADRGDARKTLSDFIGLNERTIFTYLRKDDVEDLASVRPDGFVALPMGLESFIDLRKLAGEPERVAGPVRSAHRKAVKASLKVQDRSWSSLSPIEARRVREINETWIARSRLGIELRFLNRPMLFGADPGRLFLIHLADQLVGFAVLDPYIEQGARSWMLNLIRFDSVKLWGVYLATAHTLQQQLTNEGARSLSLGLSPLLFPDDLDLSPLPLSCRLCLRALEPLRRRLYDFRGIDQYKDWLADRRELRYVAVARGMLLNATRHILKVHGISWSLLLQRRGRAARV